MRINDLRDNPGAYTPKRRKGRGPGSSKGKTAGRGIKGQKSRSGVSLSGFEGGQKPIYKRLPKRGFSSRRKRNIATINLKDLQRVIDLGKLDIARPVTEADLVDCGLVRRSADGVKLLGQGQLTHCVDIYIWDVSTSAQLAVEICGGKVHTTHELKLHKNNGQITTCEQEKIERYATQQLKGDGMDLTTEIHTKNTKNGVEIEINAKFRLANQMEVPDDLWERSLDEVKIVVTSPDVNIDKKYYSLRELGHDKHKHFAQATFHAISENESASDIYAYVEYKGDFLCFRTHRVPPFFVR